MLKLNTFYSWIQIQSRALLPSGRRGGPFRATFNTPWTDLWSHLVHIIKIPIRDLITFMALMFFIKDFTLS